MNKAELIKYRELLTERYNKYKVIYMCDGNVIADDMSYDMIDIWNLHKDMDIDAVADVVVTNFEKLINYFAKNRCDYDSLIIKPSFGFLVEEGYYKEDTETFDKRGVVVGACFVNFYRCDVVKNGCSFDINPEEVEGYCWNGEFLVDFYDFLLALDKLGFNLSGISCFSDLMHDSVCGKIVLDFCKKKVKINDNIIRSLSK